ncbi:MAG: Gfo/Idh/MocA family oxidoreductase [Clostridiales bacterium]|nr:Gfo/Idh/MocA family oxidoreductase [Clostridiales bacterium]
MLKVGVVGCGGISGSHVPNWQRMDDVEVVAVCDIRPEMFQKYPGPAHYEDFDKMLDENEFDIIDICLPTYLHAQFAIKAMKKGINVVSEKPIALEEEDVIAIYETAEKMNVKYMVAQCLRFWAEYEFVKSCYESGVYGKLLTANLWRLGGYPKRSFFDWYTKKELSGLIPFDLHIHDLDFLVYAFGAPKSYVFNRKELPGNDYLSATYDYGDFFVNTEASWYKAGYPFYMGFRFQFEQAVVALEKDGLTVYDANGNRSKPLSGEVGIANESDFDLPSGDAYFNELRYFANCVKENRPVEKVTKESLLTVLHILNEMK